MNCIGSIDSIFSLKEFNTITRIQHYPQGITNIINLPVQELHCARNCTWSEFQQFFWLIPCKFGSIVYSNWNSAEAKVCSFVQPHVVEVSKFVWSYHWWNQVSSRLSWFCSFCWRYEVSDAGIEQSLEFFDL
jgi:hypothetical protein